MKKFLLLIMAVVAYADTSFAATYEVVGVAAVCNGEGWNNNAAVNQMTTSDGGATYTLTITNVTLEANTNYEYKIVEKGSWTEYWPNTGHNASFSVSENAIYTITYTYTVSTRTCVVTTTKTGSAGQVTHTYSIAGEPTSLFGANWDPSNTSTDMALNADNLYEWTSAEFTVTGSAMAIAFKVVRDHAWGVEYPSSNYTLSAPVGGPYTLTITFDENSHAVNATLNSPTPIVDEYSVAGNDATIFGAEWSDTNTSTNMTLNSTSNLYEWTSAEFWANEAMTLQLKVVKNHSWSTAYPQDNVSVNVPVGGPYTLTVTFDATSEAVNYILNSNAPIVHEYSIAGSPASLFGEEWSESNTSTNMALKSTSGLYEWTSAEFSVTGSDMAIAFKVVEDHAWDVAYPSGDYSLTAPIGGPYTLTVTFDADTHDVNAVLNGSPAVVDEYSVAGNDATIFGAEWSESNTSTNMTLNSTSGLYEWTSAEFNATETMTLQIKVVKNHSWSTAYPQDNVSVTAPVGGPYTLTVTFDPDSHAVNAVVNGAPVVTYEYSVAGNNASIFGAEWSESNTSTDMTEGSDGIYRWTSAEWNQATADNLEFKVVQDHSWDVSYPTDNYEMELPAGGPYTLSVGFNPTGNVVKAVLNGGVTFSIAGSVGDLFGSIWDEENTGTEMTHVGNGVYTWTSPSIQQPSSDMEVEFKVLKNHSWDESWPADNYVLTIPAMRATNCNITITFDALTETVSATSGTVTAVDEINAEKAVESVRYFNLLGVESREPFAGMNVVVTTYSDGSKTAKKVVK